MLVIENLKVAYNGRRVLEGLSARLAAGCIHGFVGLNGAGKTTFLNTLYGLKKPDEGKMIWEDRKLTRKDIAYLETENYFYSRITGAEYLSLFRSPRNYREENWNELFRLPLECLIETYSTGMKRKLALMGVLKQDLPLLILDEPFNGLDIESARLLKMILERLRTKGRTILLTSHILESLTNLCDVIYLLKDKKIAWSRKKEEFGTLERDIFSGLEKGYQDTLDRIL